MALFTSFSIRRRMIFGVLLVVGSTLTVSGLIGYHDARYETEELFDARLAQSAHVLHPLLLKQLQTQPDSPVGAALYDPWQTTPETSADEATPLGHTYESKLYFQLLDAQGQMRLRSPHAPLVASAAIGFGHVSHDGHRWRTFTLHQDGVWLTVADRDDVRNEMAEKIGRQILNPFLLALPVLLLMLWWLVNTGMRPLTRLIAAIGERHPANLNPLTISQPMQELLPLTDEINRLMRALAETLEHEKQFTNVAAHELRTPLAVLRIHGENALNSADAASREQSLQKMLAAIDRGDRLLRQLLTQARIDNQQAIEQETVDLAQLLREAMAELAPLALKKTRNWRSMRQRQPRSAASPSCLACCSTTCSTTPSATRPPAARSRRGSAAKARAPSYALKTAAPASTLRSCHACKSVFFASTRNRATVQVWG